MPVRFAARFLHVVAQQVDFFSTHQVRKVDCLVSTVAALVNFYLPKSWLVLARRVIQSKLTRRFNVLCPSLTVKRFRMVLLPPAKVTGVQNICPRSHLVAGIDDDYSPVFLRLPPVFDSFAIVCCEAGAACDADKFEAVSVGRG